MLCLFYQPVFKVPNISKKIEAFKKDVEAKKKPPEWRWVMAGNMAHCSLTKKRGGI